MIYVPDTRKHYFKLLGIIVGAIIGALLGILVLLAIVWYWVKFIKAPAGHHEQSESVNRKNDEINCEMK